MARVGSEVDVCGTEQLKTGVALSVAPHRRIGLVENGLDFFHCNQPGTDDAFHRFQELLDLLLRIHDLDDDRQILGDTKSGSCVKMT